MKLDSAVAQRAIVERDTELIYTFVVPVWRIALVVVLVPTVPTVLVLK